MKYWDFRVWIHFRVKYANSLSPSTSIAISTTISSSSADGLRLINEETLTYENITKQEQKEHFKPKK
jgi:hypothetical protein